MEKNYSAFSTFKVGADIGNSTCKIVGENNYYDMYDSCLVRNMGDEKKLTDERTIEIDGNSYTIGEGDLTAQTAASRNLDEYEALLVYGLCKYIDALGVNKDKVKIDFHLGIGLPTADYASFKDIYREKFDKKTYNVSVNGIDYSFTITELRVVPQGSIVAHTNKKLFNGITKGYIIDWGSFTVDIQEVNKGVLSKKGKDSFEKGTLTMLRGLSTILKKHRLSLTNDKDIESLLIQGRIKIPGDNKYLSIKDDEVHSYIKEQVLHVVEDIKRFYPQINMSEKTYIMGGGAIVFGEILKGLDIELEDNETPQSLFNDIVIDANPERVNARAYYEFVGGK